MKYKIELFENYMKEHNLSKSKFCKLCDIQLSTLNKIYLGCGKIRSTALYKIAIKTGLSVDDILAMNN